MREFGDLEAAIMDVMWSATGDGLRVREVLDELNKSRDLAYTTVQTVMDILRRKGWLAREKDGRAYVYWSTHSRTDYTASLLGQVLDTSQDKTSVLMRLFDRMDPDEVKELRTALARSRRRGRR